MMVKRRVMMSKCDLIYSVPLCVGEEHLVGDC